MWKKNKCKLIISKIKIDLLLYETLNDDMQNSLVSKKNKLLWELYIKKMFEDRSRKLVDAINITRRTRNIKLFNFPIFSFKLYCIYGVYQLKIFI